jgi:hypothetical protein
MSKDAFYFPHDSNGRRDPKIVGMMTVYGAAGYGWFWMIVEVMREQDGYKLPIDKKYSYNSIAGELNEDVDTIRDFIEECVEEFELFRIEDGFLYSDSLIERMKPLEQKRARAKAAADKRWGNNKEKKEDLPFDLDEVPKKPKSTVVDDFLEVFNGGKKRILPNSTGHDSLSTKAIRNLNKLIKRYDLEQFEIAITEMFQNKWVHDTGNTGPAHLLVEDNFDRYYTKGVEKGSKTTTSTSNLSYDQIMNG